MSLVKLATERRVTVAMFGVLMLVFGLISLKALGVNLLPDLSYPTLTVRTEYQGAAPEEIEKLITQPVEELVGTVKGVKRLQSTSRAGQSDVLLEFEWGTDMENAGLDVREKLEIIQLPVQSERPVLLRFNPSTDPVLRVAFFDDSVTGFDETALKRVRRLADEEIKKRLEPIDGVAAVKISGGLEDEIQILIDPQRLARLGLSIERVIQRLSEENVNVSGGRLEQGSERYLVRTVNQFQAIGEMGDLVVAIQNDRPVYLRDVAQIRDGYKERQAIIRNNGREAVEIAIYKEGDANTVAVADAVKARMQSVEDFLPEGMQLSIVDDQSVFIDQAISEVVNAAALGGILAVLIIFFFLGNAWSTAVISVSIPLSVIATFFFMDWAGLSLNIMSLGGIALAVGLLVDNAIVVLENISRKREQGADAMQAAQRGTREVGGAVFASTLTTIAVFLPLVFVEGIGGQLFRDQALTVTFALVISLVVAMTFIPMLASMQKKSRHAFTQEETQDLDDRKFIVRLWNNVFGRIVANVFAVFIAAGRLIGKIVGGILYFPARAIMFVYDRVAGSYDRVLPWALANRFLVVFVALLAMGWAVFQSTQLGAELIPQLAQGRFQAEVKMAPGTPLEDTDGVIARMQNAGMGTDQVANIFAVSGSGNRIDANPTESGENIGRMLIDLEAGASPAAEARARDALRKVAEDIHGAEAKFSRPELFSFSTPLEIELVGFELPTLKQAGDMLATKLRESDRFVDVRSSLEQGHPEIQIFFDQERAAALGMTVREIADQVVRQVRGEVATRYSRNDRKIDVLVRAAEDHRSSVSDIESIIVNPGSERPITLASVAQIVAAEGPAEITRVNQERAAVVSANLAYGTLKDAVVEVEAVLAEIQLPFGVASRVAGQSEEMDQSFASLLFALGLAIFLVYLVMASQFESLIHPFVILLSVPLALVGAILALTVTGTPISVIVFIGVIMLAGIVVNNAIVLVDLINQLRDQGMEKKQAILEAGRARLRPIVMTTLTTTLGLLQLALGVGDGSEVRTPMAVTVIGGLLFSTLLTLVVVPVMYDVLASKHRRKAVVDNADAAVVGSQS